MRLVTWNINSIRARIDRVIAFLERSNTDVLAMQELKCKPDQFPFDRFEDAGYEVKMTGMNQWNGVAIASRVGLKDVETNFPTQPTFKDKLEARAISAVCDGVRVWSLYIPNGRTLQDPHYQYKLEFLNNLANYTRGYLEKSTTPLALVGDWNVAPLDEDVWDISVFEGDTHVSEPERMAFNQFSRLGMKELTREYVTNYTYWDYQKLRFPKNEGMRIDFVYASPDLAERAIGADIDRNERKGKGASDHVPVIVDFQ
ncbi:exodeoxyribonuclease III [Gleimia hominis]|uniref:Exodeoxyribonuclease III n=1 Tax=Gleimia hominis TaxID=595468 RepID=A0ABU3IAS7_9ACTO|nr:exodeoxyribonuclease III [Gleimia hominis]MDT3767016.1 exodeoxyribonuclease III [Gleimia hominis]